MGTRVFVGGLSYRVRERDLERFFRKYGVVRDISMKNGYAFVEFDDYRDADDAVYELNGKDLLGERVIVEHARGTDRSRRSRDRFGGGGGGGGGFGRRRWERVSVERARGTPRGGDRWKDRDRGTGVARPPPPMRRRVRSPFRSPRRDRRDDRGGGGNRAGDRYGPPTRTEYRLIVENLSSRVSWQDLKDYMRQAGEVTYADAHKNRRNEGVVEFMTSSDMKAAIEKLDGAELNGRKIRLVEDKNRRGGRRSRSSSGSRSASRSRSRSNRSRRSRSRRSSRSRSRSKSAASRSKSRSRSKSPKPKVDRRSKSHSRSKSPPAKKARTRSRSRSKSATQNGSASKERSPSRSRSRSRSPSADKDQSKSRSASPGKDDQQD